MPDQFYRCPDCAHECAEADMDGDGYYDDDGTDVWCNWICPSCHVWHDLEDWVLVSAPKARSAAGRCHDPS